jgi:hypothetical protein
LELWHVPGIAIGVVDGDLEWSQVSISDFCFAGIWAQ